MNFLWLYTYVKFSKYRWITGYHNSFSIRWISAPGGDESAGIRSTPSRWVPAAAAVIRCVSGAGAAGGRDHEKWDLPEAEISKNWCVEDILRWKWWTLQKKGVLDDEFCWVIFAAQNGKLRLAVGHESVCHIFSVQQFLSHQSEYLFLTPNIIYYQF
jgi:hypothetical protein